MDEQNIYKKIPAKSSAWDVIKAFWQGMKPAKGLFFFDVISVILANLATVSIPIFYKRFFNAIVQATDKHSVEPFLIHTVLIILALNLVMWVFYRTNTFAHNYFQANTMANLKNISFDYMIHHSYTFFANNFTGTLTQRVNRFAKAFERLTDRFVWTMIPLFIQVVGTIIIVWYNSPAISLIIIAWVFVFVVFNYGFSRWKLKYDIIRAEIDSKATGYLSDTITNSNTIHLFTGQEFEKKGFGKVNTEQAEASVFSWNLGAVVDSLQAGIILLAEFVLLYMAVRLWARGEMSIGTIILIQIYFIGLGARLWDLTRIIRDIYEGFADAKEMIDIMKLPHEIKDLPIAKPLVLTTGKIAYKDLIFSFNQTRTVLKDFNLSIPPGQKVALIGPSGAGKSTIVRLLLRLYDPTDGGIYIDGQNIKEVTQESLRENISLVPQDPVLFHRTLKENIRYGRRDATDEEVLEAGRLAHCDEFIKGLPLGYNTFVGERGIKLSGGERQRVAIARAILKNAPILILDEATSSLDSESESLIQDALDILMKNKTVIVIAHRLSTIRKMDRIVVIDNGAISEEGSHDELLKKDASLYKKLWDLQAGGFIPEEE